MVAGRGVAGRRVGRCRGCRYRARAGLGLLWQAADLRVQSDGRDRDGDVGGGHRGWRGDQSDEATTDVCVALMFRLQQEHLESAHCDEPTGWSLLRAGALEHQDCGQTADGRRVVTGAKGGARGTQTERTRGRVEPAGIRYHLAVHDGQTGQRDNQRRSSDRAAPDELRTDRGDTDHASKAGHSSHDDR